MGGSYDERMLEEQRKDASASSSQPKAPETDSANGKSSLGISQHLAPGESLDNGNYKLTYNSDGSLVLTDPADGALKTWDPTLSPGVDSKSLADGSLRMESDGTLYIADKDGNKLATIPGTSGQLCYENLSLSLGDDGTLQAASMGKKVGSVLYDGKSLYGLEYPLYHPPQESAALDAVLDAAELAIAGMAKPLKSNNPTQIPQDEAAVIKDLVQTDMLDPNDNSKMNSAYDQHQSDIRKTAQDLKDNDGNTVYHIDQLPQKIQSGLQSLGKTYDSLNDKLKAVSSSFAAKEKAIQDKNPGTVSVPSYVKISDTLASDPNKFPNSIDDTLASLVSEALHDISNIVLKVHDDMKSTADDVDPTAAQQEAALKKKQAELAKQEAANEAEEAKLAKEKAALQASAKTTATPATTTSTADTTTDTTTSPTDATTGTTTTDTTATTPSDTTTPTDTTTTSATPANTTTTPANTTTTTTTPTGTSTATPAASSTTDPSSMLQQLETMQALQQAAGQKQTGSTDGQGAGSDSNSTGGQQNSQSASNQAAQAAQNPAAASPAVDTQPSATAAQAADTSGNHLVTTTVDGEKVQIPSAVRDAIEHALNTPNGCDARAAYAGTAGDASTWTQIDDPSKLQTGDVIAWGDRSAVVIHDSTGLHMINDGKIVGMNQQAYGNFAGYFHPAGADLTGPTEQASQNIPNALAASDTRAVANSAATAVSAAT